MQPGPPGLKQSSHFSLLSSWDHRCIQSHLDYFCGVVFCFVFWSEGGVETGSCQVAQAGLELMGSSNSSASASQSAGSTAMRHYTQPSILSKYTLPDDAKEELSHVPTSLSVIGPCLPFMVASGKQLGTPGTQFCSCGPGWSAVTRSRLTATSASQHEALLLPQPPNICQAYACGTRMKMWWQEFLYIAQAGLELLTSSNLPVLVSQNVGIT
ncbi:Histone demethylase UTY, partial [Plecturocebus cupreus]